MTSQRTVLVTGATGRIGRQVVDALRSDATPVRVRALTRDPSRASFPDDVEVLQGDFADPASLDVALRDVEAVFLVWTAPITTAEAVMTRLAADARRIVYLSAPHQVAHPFFQQPNPMRAMHMEMERVLAAATTNSVVLRPGMFASNAWHWWMPQLRTGDVVRWPYPEAETAPLDERDLAAVAVRTLLDARHEGREYVLTGPESLSQAAQIAAIGAALGRAVTIEDISPDELRRDTAGTWPPVVVDMLLNAWQATLGHQAYVTNDVTAVLGVKPRTFLQWAVDQITGMR